MKFIVEFTTHAITRKDFTMLKYFNLFNGVLVDEKRNEYSKYLLSKTGVLVDKSIVKKYGKLVVFNFIDDNVINNTKINSTFHKTWGKVENTCMTQLVAEQLLHYFSTYGLNHDGASSPLIYIPNEKVKLPKKYKGDIPILILRALTKDDIIKKFNKLVTSSMAMNDSDMNDLVMVSNECNIPININSIINKELSCRFCNEYNMIPKDPIEFLRLLIYATTESTLIIKNKETITKIKEYNGNIVNTCLQQYITQQGINPLASIFYRYKPLFLAFKNTKHGHLTNTIINKISKLAPKFHKPMTEDFLSTITKKLKHGEVVDLGILEVKLNKTNIYRKIRLSQAINFHTNNESNIYMYRIRNGSSYVTTKTHTKTVDKLKTLSIQNVIMKSIIADIKPKLTNKKIFLDADLVVPISGKSFSGNIPNGSSWSTKKDLVLGVNWNNVDDRRVDLDLSMICVSGKTGWDADYKNVNFSFSGDITDAPQGASESFKVNIGAVDGVYLLNLNYYNSDLVELDIPYTIFIARTHKFKDVITTTDKLLFHYDSTITPSKSQKLIGILKIVDGLKTFYTHETSTGKFSTSGMSDVSLNMIKYFDSYLGSQIKLKDFLQYCGATMVDSPEESDIDLSLNNITKEKLIGLLE